MHGLLFYSMPLSEDLQINILLINFEPLNDNICYGNKT